MKRIIGTLLAVCMLTGGLFGVAAQQSEPSVIASIGETVTWSGADGSVVSTLTVNSVDNDFRDYQEESGPDYGYVYKLVQFTLTNELEGATILEPSAFGMVDDHGRAHTRINVQTNDAAIETFDSPIALAPGETTDLVMAFQTPAHANAAIFTWNPERSQSFIVALSTDMTETSAIVWGMNTPAVYTDDFGNPVSSMQITGINDNWTEHTDSDAPGDGEAYLAVHITLTNMTDRPVVYGPRDFELIDGNGEVQRTSYARADENAEQQAFRDPITLQPGETADAMLVFDVVSGEEPVALSWHPSWSITNMVVLQEAPEPVEGTPEPVGTPI